MKEQIILKNKHGSFFCFILLFDTLKSFRAEQTFIIYMKYMTVEGVQNWLLLLDQEAVVTKAIRIIQFHLVAVAAIEIFQTYTILTLQL